MFLKGETLKGSLLEEGSPPKKAISKGSPEVKEGCSPDKELGIRATKEPIGDLNDDFEEVCNCNVDHQVVRYSDFVNLFVEKAAEADSGFEVGHIVVNVPAFFDHSQRKAIRDAGAISGIYVCRVSSEPEPATKPRGCPGEEPTIRANMSLKDEPQLGTSESVPEPMLRTAFCLLQMAHLLLQSGQQAKEAEEKVAKKRVARVSVACQTALDEIQLEESAESEETAAAEASREVALLKAALEEDMEHCDESSGYGSDCSSLKSEGRPSGGIHFSDVSASSKGAKGSRARRHKGKKSQNVVFDRSGVHSLTSPSKVAPTVSEEMSYSDGPSKPVLSNAEQGTRVASKKNQLARSQAAAGPRQVLLVPVDEEQLGQPEAQELQGQCDPLGIQVFRATPS